MSTEGLSSSWLDLESEAKALWQKTHVVSRAVSDQPSERAYVFYEGPPSANGEPGIHHWMARTIKDILCRYKTMQGYRVHRKAGWDTHGLPVELAVEKNLGISKEDIGKKVSVAAFVSQCRATVGKHKAEWERFTEAMGFWIDQSAPYMTSDAPYIETLWWLLKQLYDKDLLYLGHTIQPYSPAAGTSLSQHELNQPGCYREIQSPSLTVQFPLKGALDTYLLAWTTTAWTLPANAALGVGADMDYVGVRTLHPHTHEEVVVILGRACLGRYFDARGEGKPLRPPEKKGEPMPYVIEKYYKGKDLDGCEYTPLMTFPNSGISGPKTHQCHVADFVSTEEGTGIVHIAPTFGMDDFQLARKAHIAPVLCADGKPIVDESGRFRAELGEPLGGCYVRTEYDPTSSKEASAHNRICRLLKSQNRLFSIANHTHNYPHCWRTDKPILYYPISSWCIRTSTLRERLMALNETIHWYPSATGVGRFAHWLANLQDWNLSRTRYWGTPLPIWTSRDQGGERRCMGSFQELEKEMQRAIKAGLMSAPTHAPTHKAFDPHRPHIDNFVLCGNKGQPLYRVPEVIDVWFDSGAMPYAQWHYPFENKAKLQSAHPADFISEGVDQTRGWFFTLHAISGLVFDRIAYKNVISTGFVLDAKGHKMSKRLGNSVSPFAILKRYGADATRWYFATNAAPWENLKFETTAIEQIQRRFFDTLRHSLQFYVMYADLDHFVYPSKSMSVSSRPLMDRWMCAAVGSLVSRVTRLMDAYQPHTAARAIQRFVMADLSNWYVRLNRKRFWKSEQGADKQSAYETLYESLSRVLLLMAPFAPFVTEALYQRLVKTAQPKKDTASALLSIHEVAYPQAPSKGTQNADLLQSMARIQQLVSMAHALRKKAGIKVRQPLSRLLVGSPNQKALQAEIGDLAYLITQETNTKTLAYIQEGDALLKKRARLDFKKAGARYGAKVQQLKGLVEVLDETAIATLETKGSYALEVAGERITLQRDEVVIWTQDIPNFCATSDADITVALDTKMTPELQHEGWAREVINRIQNMRKSQNLNLNDKIDLSITTMDQDLRSAIRTHKAHIVRETQATQLTLIEDQTRTQQKVEIDGKTLCIQLHT